jgi:hypothetical protein
MPRVAMLDMTYPLFEKATYLLMDSAALPTTASSLAQLGVESCQMYPDKILTLRAENIISPSTYRKPVRIKFLGALEQIIGSG